MRQDLTKPESYSNHFATFKTHHSTGLFQCHGATQYSCIHGFCSQRTWKSLYKPSRHGGAITYRKGNFGIIRTVTRYYKYEPEGSKGCDLPSFTAAIKVENVTVIAAKMDFNQRIKAPRRQCCKTRRRKRAKSIEVQIRDCHPWEISSPP
ncbi:uncharacterized protein A4U43_C07F1360 [Asparagus officinalis]|uniref:Uncharacterized protein n=1 Tax=Asparagus officinalis TaxID=4686 RepID=A0A5P1E8G9_ASPOF|nr:uncharacterized protein A4U43_C07F1360 [Asparagus officinalis]